MPCMFAWLGACGLCLDTSLFPFNPLFWKINVLKPNAAQAIHLSHCDYVLSKTLSSLTQYPELSEDWPWFMLPTFSCLPPPQKPIVTVTLGPCQLPNTPYRFLPLVSGGVLHAENALSHISSRLSLAQSVNWSSFMKLSLLSPIGGGGSSALWSPIQFSSLNGGS